ncbi:SDR family oxidoreductase [Roseibium aggregatum]|uniref:SDR family oxidoreductase n=1 Tax=Roseibium aggregatum TaxID=187304 RepID=A0A939EGN4_9HYPH|nr:SDR family oxidoreductase [Roseibium aggregatum]MBN9672633.1 SDR family oxidoreductase [Roseibium aggregatum]
MKKAVVLGAYGFIGGACVRALQEEGFAVLGIGRSVTAAQRAFPDLVWIIRDIASVSAEEWKELLADADVVVNASGALQDGSRDNLTAIHETAVSRVVEALTGSKTRFIQISAAGVSEDAPTGFFRTKARGDRTVVASAIDWIVLRPVLVLGREAYGGTALLRASAALPLIGGKAFPQAKVQTVHVTDLARAVAQAATGSLGSRFVADLAEDQSRTFWELTVGIRSWLGYAPWRAAIAVPAWTVRLIGKGADALGWLGWRSPLRTNALKSLESGITGDPQEWRRRGGTSLKSLEETLRAMPATAQERAFSRVYLILPLAIGCLSLFWLLSGLMGLWSFRAAQSVLTETDVAHGIAGAAVIGGSVIDILLGLGVLWRRWTRPACLGMAAVSLGYLFFGTLLTPELWADPLGPFVKIFPALVLALAVAFLLDER